MELFSAKLTAHIIAHFQRRVNAAPALLHRWLAGLAQTARNTMQVLWPPKPKELLIATRTSASRAVFGT